MNDKGVIIATWDFECGCNVESLQRRLNETQCTSFNAVVDGYGNVSLVGWWGGDFLSLEQAQAINRRILESVIGSGGAQ